MSSNKYKTKARAPKIKPCKSKKKRPFFPPVPPISSESSEGPAPDWPPIAIVLHVNMTYIQGGENKTIDEYRTLDKNYQGNPWDYGYRDNYRDGTLWLHVGYHDEPENWQCYVRFAAGGLAWQAWQNDFTGNPGESTFYDIQDWYRIWGNGTTARARFTL